MIQGCQVFLDTIYQHGEKYTKLPLNYQMAKNITNGRKLFQMAINIATLSILGPSKIYPNWDFLFENIPSGSRDMTVAN
jgi:hypothetical protein